VKLFNDVKLILAGLAAVVVTTAAPVLSQTAGAAKAQSVSIQKDSASTGQAESVSVQKDSVLTGQAQSASVPKDSASTGQAQSVSIPKDSVSTGQTESALIQKDSTSAGDSSEAVAQSEDAEDAVDPDDAETPDISGPAAPKRVRLGQPGRLDGIAAVVGDEIILSSEVEAYAYMRLSATGADPDAVDAPAFLRECLDELIDNKVLLVRAIEDSTVNVRGDEVESMLNNHINAILRQNSITTEQLDAQLRAQQGTTLARFKTEARRAIREQLLKQKLQQGYYFSTRVSRRDVERFYEQYADSLPEIGESFELLKLSVKLASSDSVRQAAHDKVRAAKREIDAGMSFEEAAKKYSESPEGASGGDLGYLTKGSTTELVFEERAFTLPVGQVSEPFETRLGYHVILVEEKRDMRVKLRQILVRHAPTERQREEILAKLDSLRGAIKDRAAFEAAAREVSVDAATRARGGNMGWLSLFEISPTVRTAVQGLEAGQISETITEEDNTLSIYMVAARADSRRLTLQNDYTVIAEKAKDIMAQQQLLDSVKKWRGKVFIDVRI